MTAYYNEFDPYAAQWLRNLISAGLIAPGDVDTRSIVDVQPDDLRGYTQCHFFAGIGGWSYASRLAGWSDDRPLWTGSCPCQPYSVAGKGEGEKDPRHLWPEFFRLIRARRPDVVMGEQVAAAVGKHWLDGVCADLEGVGYAVGAAVVPACAVDAPHRRNRLWFVADSFGAGLAQREREPGVLREVGSTSTRENAADDAGFVGHTDLSRSCARTHNTPAGHGNSTSTNERPRPWHSARWLCGEEGKARRVEPGIRLLAHGVPARVGKLRAYGNAIVPQVAAEIIGAYMDAVSDRDLRLTGIFA